MKTEIKTLTDDIKSQYAYGIKAYGSWDLFTTKARYNAYLKDWVAGTDGAERDRAVEAQCALDEGIPYWDSDRSVAA